MARVASLGGWHPVELTLTYRGKRTLRLQVTDDAADGLRIDPPVHDCVVASNSRVHLYHKLLPERRGHFELQYVYLSLLSWGGLWRRTRTLPVPGTLHVYPNIQQISEYALLARTNRLSLIGVRKTRRAGQESNFERLRDYQAAFYACAPFAGPFWRAGQAAPPPPELAHIVATFHVRGEVPPMEDDSIPADHWRALLIGLGVVPESYPPRIDATDPETVKTDFRRMLGFVKDTVLRQPTHAQALGGTHA